MSTPKCPKCGREITSEEINVPGDIAYCRACNLVSKLSELASRSALTDGIELRSPPAGAWFGNDARGTIVGATHRSLASALLFLGISLFWNGIVSVFVVINIAGTMRHLDFPVPVWFPSPDVNGAPPSVGMTLFLWLFLTPFIVIGLGMIGGLLSCVAGHTEVQMKGANGVVFTGIGPLGYRRRFDPSAIKDVRIDDGQWTDSDGHSQRKPAIVIEANSGKLTKFGTMLTEERRKFIAAAVRLALVRQG